MFCIPLIVSISGGTTKRTTAKASLARIQKDQIITPQDVFNFCKENINGITYIWCSDESVELLIKDKLAARYATAKTVNGTHQYHHFSPVPGSTNIEAKFLSLDEFSKTHKTCKI